MKTISVCPNCLCDNQDMIVGEGKNMMSCEACDYEWHECEAIEKKETLKEEITRYLALAGEDYTDGQVIDLIADAVGYGKEQNAQTINAL